MGVARKRWIVPWKDSVVKPAMYHCISRVVDRQLVFGAVEKEKFRTLMRMQEGFTGCRVLGYCLMGNHIHLLVDVPPRPEGGLSDEGLLGRLRAIYDGAVTAEVAKELAEARCHGADQRVAAVHARYSYRMHDLSEFMKTLMQRFTQWFNRTHGRTGNLWEDAFKSVIVEDGVAAKTMAAYIDLNPVRAGIVTDPAAYRWSSYGEAMGGGPKGNGKKARAGLVRALRAQHGAAADAGLWASEVSCEYRRVLMAGAVAKTAVVVDRAGRRVVKTLRKGMAGVAAESPNEREGDTGRGAMLRQRVRYFTDGAVIGSRQFVNEVFAQARERFGPRRRDGARKLRGPASPAAGVLWSMRDLRKGIS